MKKCHKIIKEKFLEQYSAAKTELAYSSDYQLLCAIIMSAQCTDARVNKITPQLFEKYPTPKELCVASQSDVEQIIGSCSYFRNKSANLIAMANIVTKKFNGKIPQNEEDLLTLPGVGQKTAHVFLIEYCNQDFMAVDTHVFRTSHRLGLSSDKTAKQTEATLVKIFKTDLNVLHQAFVLFGRYICKAKKPLCEECFVAQCCVSKAGFKPS